MAHIVKGLMLTAAVLVAGCGKEPSEPRTAEEVVAEAAKLERPRPGLYRTSVDMLEFSVPGLPPQQAEKMKAMMGDVGGQERSYCLTPADAEKGYAESIRQMSQGKGGMACDYDRFDVDGARLSARMVCKGPQGMNAVMEIDGTTDSESTSMTMDMTQTSAMIPGGEMRMTMKMDSRREGDCP